MGCPKPPTVDPVPGIIPILVETDPSICQGALRTGVVCLGGLGGRHMVAPSEDGPNRAPPVPQRPGVRVEPSRRENGGGRTGRARSCGHRRSTPVGEDGGGTRGTDRKPNTGIQMGMGMGIQMGMGMGMGKQTVWGTLVGLGGFAQGCCRVRGWVGRTWAACRWDLLVTVSGQWATSRSGPGAMGCGERGAWLMTRGTAPVVGTNAGRSPPAPPRPISRRTETG